MRIAPDSTPIVQADSFSETGVAPDSAGPIPFGLGAAADLFCSAQAAEGASPETVEWVPVQQGTLPAPGAKGQIDPSAVPDFVAVAGRDGGIVGYVGKPAAANQAWSVYGVDL